MKTVLAQLKQYKKDTFLTVGFTTLEVIMEVLLPFITALIIDNGLEQSNMSAIIKYGILMLVMALVSLFSGAMAGKYAASASSGFACNLRESMYVRVQDYSFSNIDKFSTAGLVTSYKNDDGRDQCAECISDDYPYRGESAADADFQYDHVLSDQSQPEPCVPGSFVFPGGDPGSYHEKGDRSVPGGFRPV